MSVQRDKSAAWLRGPPGPKLAVPMRVRRLVRSIPRSTSLPHGSSRVGRLALATLAAASLPFVFANGCASSDEDGPPTYGPVVEAGTSDSSTAASDATANRDASAANDASRDTGLDTGLDGTSTTDARSTDAVADVARDVVVPPADAGCPSGYIAIAGGNTTAAFGALWNDGRFTPAISIGTSSASPPALLSAGTGFLAVFRASGTNLLSSAQATLTDWGQLSALGTVAAENVPTLALVGTEPNLVYRGTDSKFYRGAFTSNAWDSANEPVGIGGDQSFGPSGPASTAVGSELLFAQSGTDGHVYARKRVGTWQTPIQVSTEVADKQISPALSPLVGGTRDALAVWVNLQGHLLKYSTRSGSNWSAPADVYNMAPSNVAFSDLRVVVSPLAAGRAVLAYTGTDGNVYFSLFDGATQPTWSAPARVTTAANMSPTVPALAGGTCSSDAVLGFVDGSTGGVVKLTRLSGTSWTTPETVPQTNGTSFVAIATK